MRLAAVRRGNRHGGQRSDGARQLEARSPRGWWRGRRRRTGRVRKLPLLAMIVLLLPVPWLHVVGDDPLSHAWRLDGRLFVEDQRIDPPGEWSWLAIGRPPLVAEVLRDRVLGEEDTATDLRVAPTTYRPALNEPAAAAVGLRHAGHDLALGLLVEARDPLLAGYPEVAVISSMEGVELTDRATWDRIRGGIDSPQGVASRRWARGADEVEFRLPDGRSFTAPGSALPYARIHTLDVAPPGLEASITNVLAELAPVDWLRNLALGSSHGSMVALTTYAQASGRDLAQGRHIAGTGGIQGDGTITRIGGLPAKARAARNGGADVLFFPASQADDLDGFAADGMALAPITTLTDAIEWLEKPVA